MAFSKNSNASLLNLSGKGLRALYLGLSFLLMSSLLAQDTRYYDQYRNNEVRVDDRTGGRAKAIILRDITRTAIIYSFANNPRGILEMPINNENMKLFYAYPREWQVALTAMANEDHEAAVVALRPFAYPLIKYLVLKPQNFNGHMLVGRFYKALIAGQMYEEAMAVARVLPLTRLDEEFLNDTMILTEKLVESGDIDMAMRTMSYIPITIEREDFLPLVMDFAGRLRRNGDKNLLEALAIYKRVKEVTGTETERPANLWAAYVNILLDNPTAAELFMERTQEAVLGDPDFPLYKLVKGRIHLAKEEYRLAMRNISEGIVRADIVDDWMPDLMYSSGLNYEMLDEKLVASNVFHQLHLFYPKNHWAKEASVRMQNLPAPAEADVDDMPGDMNTDTEDAIMSDDEGWE